MITCVPLTWTNFAPSRSATPLYQQVASYIRAAIADGRLAPGDGLPGEQQMADYMRVSYDTVRRALGVLRDEGLIVTSTGIGSFVAEPRT